MSRCRPGGDRRMCCPRYGTGLPWSGRFECNPRRAACADRKWDAEARCASFTQPISIDSPCAASIGTTVRLLRATVRDPERVQQLVDRALAERVDFVLIVGDIYDRDWQDFHTGLFFCEQLVRLGRAGFECSSSRAIAMQGVISKQLALPPHVTVFSSRTARTVRLDDLSTAIHGRSFPERGGR